MGKGKGKGSKKKEPHENGGGVKKGGKGGKAGGKAGGKEGGKAGGMSRKEQKAAERSAQIQVRHYAQNANTTLDDKAMVGDNAALSFPLFCRPPRRGSRIN